MGNLRLAHGAMAYGSTTVVEEVHTSKTGMTRKAISFASIVGMLLVACIAVSMLQLHPEELAAKGGKALTYGTKVTLKNVYNEYLIVDPNGKTSGGPYWGNNNQIKIIKAKSGKGPVKYGDKVALQGQNGKYLMSNYAGKVTCRASVIAADTTFTVKGGSGPVMLNDIIQLQSEYGYLHAQPGGATSFDRHPNTLAKFTLGIPGQENGLRSARGIMYGDVIKCANRVGDYLIANKNGWFEMKGTGSNPMENLVILSEQHREGHISFGDVITLRAHNGRFVTAAPDGHVEAVTNDMNDNSMWTIYGTLGASSGYVHSRDRIMFRGDRGFISSKASPSGEHVRSDTNDRSEAVWTLNKVWEQTM